MMNTHDGAGSEEGPKTVGTVLKLLFVVIMSMALYAYLMLSSNKAVLPATIVLLSILEVVQLRRMYKELGGVYAGCEVGYFCVLLLFGWAAYHDLLANHRTFVFATIFYRPYFTLFCNRRLAFILALLIIAVVLPITCGIATDSDFVDLLTAFYALLVLSLWAFCSKLGARVFGFEENS